MSSGSVTSPLEDETILATYNRLSVLSDAWQALIGKTEVAGLCSEWVKSMRSDLSKHNHKDLISDDDWCLDEGFTVPGHDAHGMSAG